MREWGFGEQAIAAARGEARRTVVTEAFRPHPDNQVAVQLFLALQSQWRVTSRSTWTRAETIRIGLDYGVIRETADLELLQLSLPDDFRRIRIMEAEALSAWAEDARAQR